MANRMNIRYFNAWSIFAIVFAFKLLFIFQGIDLTDEGYHLTQQVAAFTDKVDYKDVTITYFLTQYVGGAWLKIWGAPNLLWARLGGVILYALNAAVIFKILSGYFEQKKTFLAVAATALFITMHEYTTIIHYYTFPSLLLNLWLLTLSHLIKSGEDTVKPKEYGFLLGFLIVPIILSRISLILMLLLPGFVAAYYWKTKTEGRQLKKAAPYMIYGMLASAAAFALFYMQIGIFDHYVGNILGTLTAFITGTKDVGDFGETHSMSNLIWTYLGGWIKGVRVLLLIFVPVLSLTAVIIGKKEVRLGGLIILMSLAGFIIANAHMIETETVYYFAEFIIAAVAITLLFISAILLYIDRKKNIDRTLLLSSVFIIVITPVGSILGLSKSTSGMWLVMPLTMLLVYDAVKTTKDLRLKSARPMLGVFLVFLVIASILFQIVNFYSDDKDMLNLNTEFTYAPLRNVYSTPERVKVVDEVLFKIEEYTEKGDRVLMVTSIPLFYYLTETKPAFGDPWPVFRPLEKIREDNERMIASGRYPKLFIYSKFETNKPEWPNTNVTTYYPDVSYIEYFKHEYINNLNYTLLWENKAFAIYGRGDR